MTSRTTRQHIRFLNVILADQRLAFSNLVVALVFRAPLHVKNFFFWPHEFFRISMTAQAPFHLQCGRLIRNRHLIEDCRDRREDRRGETVLIVGRERRNESNLHGAGVPILQSLFRAPAGPHGCKFREKSA